MPVVPHPNSDYLLVPFFKENTESEIMNEIDKEFDGVSWEWRGKTFIGLKPICPDCKYELDIKMADFKMKQELTEDGILSLTIPHPRVSYSCPKCSFSTNTTIDGVDSPKDLRKAVLREFQHRQRLKASENTKD